MKHRLPKPKSLKKTDRIDVGDYSGADIDPNRIDIDFGDLPICRNGGRAAEFDESAAHDYIAQPEFSITVRLNNGTGSCVFWTTDLTVEYIHINADYST